MPGPVLGAGGELVVQGAQARFLRGRYLAMNRDEEVAVAVDIRIADRERPLKIGPGEIVPEKAPGPLGQLPQDRVQFGKPRWALIGGWM